MTPRSTIRLAGCDLDYAGNAYEIRTEVSCPTIGPLENMVSLLVKILVEK